MKLLVKLLSLSIRQTKGTAKRAASRVKSPATGRSTARYQGIWRSIAWCGILCVVAFGAAALIVGCSADSPPLPADTGDEAGPGR